MQKLFKVVYDYVSEEECKIAIVGVKDVKEIILFDDENGSEKGSYCEINYNDGKFERVYNISSYNPINIPPVLTDTSPAEIKPPPPPTAPTPVSDELSLKMSQLANLGKSIDSGNNTEPVSEAEEKPTPINNSKGEVFDMKKNINGHYLLIVLVLLISAFLANSYIKQIGSLSDDTGAVTSAVSTDEQSTQTEISTETSNSSFVDEFKEKGVSDSDVIIDTDNSENISDSKTLNTAEIVLKFSSLRNTETLDDINGMFGVNGVIDATRGTNDYVWRFNDTTMIKGSANTGGIFRDLSLIAADNDLKDISIMPVSKTALDGLKEKAETTFLTYDDFKNICGGVDGTALSMSNGRITSYAWVGEETKFVIKQTVDGKLTEYTVEYLVKEVVSLQNLTETTPPETTAT